MRFGIYGLAAVAVLTPMSVGYGFTADFDDIAASTSYDAGDTFTSDGADITISVPGGGTANARISSGTTVGNGTNALGLFGGTRADFDLGAGSSGGAFYFSDSGGDNFLEINGQALDFDDIAAVADDPGQSQGTLAGVTYRPQSISTYYVTKLEGNITSFALNGQELTVDRVTLNAVPEPASLALLAVGGGCMMSLPRRRR